MDGMLAAAWDRYDVPALLRLDEVGEDLFRNRFNQPNVNAALFSGQVVAQALAAASRTVAGRSVHSLHAYFLRPGSADRRALYRIEHIRDGRNFTTRRVAAIQDGRTLLEMLCSFATRQAGFAHQAAMPNVLPPEALSSLTDIVRGDDTGLPAYIRSFATSGPIEVKPLTRAELLGPSGGDRRSYWLRAPGAAGMSDPGEIAALLAYLSDFWLASSALTRHRHPSPDESLFVASIDHAMWFHRPLADPGDWLLYQTDSPSAEGGINLARGLIFDRHGTARWSPRQRKKRCNCPGKNGKYSALVRFQERYPCPLHAQPTGRFARSPISSRTRLLRRARIRRCSAPVPIMWPSILR